MLRNWLQRREKRDSRGLNQRARLRVEALEGRELPATIGFIGGPIEGGKSPAAVVCGDFNGDGIADLAVASKGTRSVAFLFGDGQGTFGSPQHYGLDTTSAGGDPVALAAGDFNRDGRLDLAVANKASRCVSVLLNTGGGRFSAAQNYGMDTGPGGVPLALAVADLNGDGWQDIAVANNGGNRCISVLFGAGNGRFSAIHNTGLDTTTAGGDPVDVAAADFNGDGRIDLAVANRASRCVSFLINTGGGRFAPAANYGMDTGPGGVPLALTAADLNGDGRPDVAVANNGANRCVSILFNQGGGHFSPIQNYGLDTTTAGGDPVDVISGDFNGDGIIDLAAANRASRCVTYLFGQGGGRFSVGQNYGIDSPAAGDPVGLAAGDFNRDGVSDLAVASPRNDNVGLLLSGLVKSQVSSDGRRHLTLWANGWLWENGTRKWSGTKDFALDSQGTLYWLSTGGLLQKQVSGGWQDIARNVTSFAVGHSGRVFTLASDGMLSRDGVATWPGVKSFVLQADGVLSIQFQNGASHRTDSHTAVPQVEQIGTLVIVRGSAQADKIRVGESGGIAPALGIVVNKSTQSVYGKVDTIAILAAEGDDKIEVATRNRIVTVYSGSGYNTLSVATPGANVIRSDCQRTEMSIPSAPRQKHDNGCGPAAASQFLRARGIKMDYDTARRIINPTWYGTKPGNMLDFLKRYLKDTKLEDQTSFNRIIDLLSQGKPVNALINWNNDIDTFHWVTVWGVDKSAQTITYWDPAVGGIRSMSYASFQQVWNWDIGWLGQAALAVMNVRTRTIIY